MLSLLLNFFGCGPKPDSLTTPQKRERIESMYDSYRKLGFARVPEIEPEAVDGLQDPVFLDVRPPEERAVSMIPGAIDKATFEANAEAYRNRPVVTYCTIGARSGLYAKKLQKDGYDVRNLKGSILLWSHAGRPLEDAEGATHRVHTYGRKWALLPEGYEAVY